MFSPKGAKTQRKAKQDDSKMPCSKTLRLGVFARDVSTARITDSSHCTSALSLFERTQCAHRQRQRFRRLTCGSSDCSCTALCCGDCRWCGQRQEACRVAHVLKVQNHCRRSSGFSRSMLHAK